MADATESKLREAEARGRQLEASEPRAAAARFESETRRVVVDLVNGCSYAFPVELVQDFLGVADDALAEIVVDGQGFNLHWSSLEVDLYVPALVSGIFGTRAWMVGQMARLAGMARSPSKAAAARANGAKGGRPRKSA